MLQMGLVLASQLFICLGSAFVYLECLWNVELLEENLNEFLWRLICYEKISFDKETFLPDHISKIRRKKQMLAGFFFFKFFESKWGGGG